MGSGTGVGEDAEIGMLEGSVIEASATDVCGEVGAGRAVPNGVDMDRVGLGAAPRAITVTTPCMFDGWMEHK